ncbi:MAG: hypothetical protein HFF05_03010 [Oscillospiraceae bacterium]|nr:hypothetical protein [Oscillospiraceae bacterium]
MYKRMVSLALALSMCMGLMVPAFAAEEVDHGHPNNTSSLENFSVYYEMDGENVVERASFDNIDIVRTIRPDDTMLVETTENGVVETVVIDSNYALFRDLYLAQQTPMAYGKDLTGSQYIHQYLGSPGEMVSYGRDIRVCATVAELAKLFAKKMGWHTVEVVAEIAGFVFAAFSIDNEYYKVVVSTRTYQVLFAVDHSYYIHCYHDTIKYYNEGETKADKTETDYHQAIGG